MTVKSDMLEPQHVIERLSEFFCRSDQHDSVLVDKALMLSKVQCQTRNRSWFDPDGNICGRL